LSTFLFLDADRIFGFVTLGGERIRAFVIASLHGAFNGAFVLVPFAFVFDKSLFALFFGVVVFEFEFELFSFSIK